MFFLHFLVVLSWLVSGVFGQLVPVVWASFSPGLTVTETVHGTDFCRLNSLQENPKASGFIQTVTVTVHEKARPYIMTPNAAEVTKTVFATVNRGYNMAPATLKVVNTSISAPSLFPATKNAVITVTEHVTSTPGLPQTPAVHSTDATSTSSVTSLSTAAADGAKGSDRDREIAAGLLGAVGGTLFGQILTGAVFWFATHRTPSQWNLPGDPSEPPSWPQPQVDPQLETLPALDQGPVSPPAVQPEPVDPLPVDPLPVDPLSVEPLPLEPVGPPSVKLPPVTPPPAEPPTAEPPTVEPEPFEPEPFQPPPVTPPPVEPPPVEPPPVAPEPVEPNPFDPDVFDPEIFEPPSIRPKPFKPDPERYEQYKASEPYKPYEPPTVDPPEIEPLPVDPPPVEPAPVDVDENSGNGQPDDFTHGEPQDPAKPAENVLDDIGQRLSEVASDSGLANNPEIIEPLTKAQDLIQDAQHGAIEAVKTGLKDLSETAQNVQQEITSQLTHGEQQAANQVVEQIEDAAVEVADLDILDTFPVINTVKNLESHVTEVVHSGGSGLSHLFSGIIHGVGHVLDAGVHGVETGVQEAESVLDKVASSTDEQIPEPIRDAITELHHNVEQVVDDPASAIEPIQQVAEHPPPSTQDDGDGRQVDNSDTTQDPVESRPDRNIDPYRQFPPPRDYDAEIKTLQKELDHFEWRLGTHTQEKFRIHKQIQDLYRERAEYRKQQEELAKHKATQLTTRPDLRPTDGIPRPEPTAATAASLSFSAHASANIPHAEQTAPMATSPPDPYHTILGDAGAGAENGPHLTVEASAEVSQYPTVFKNPQVFTSYEYHPSTFSTQVKPPTPSQPSPPPPRCTVKQHSLLYFDVLFENWVGDEHRLQSELERCGELTDWSYTYNQGTLTWTAHGHLPLNIAAGCVGQAWHNAGGPDTSC